MNLSSSKSFVLQKVEERKYCLYCLEGTFDAINYTEFINILDKALETHDLVLDFSGLRFMSTAGLSALFYLYQSAHQKGRKILIFGISKNILDVIRLINLESFLSIYDTKEEALSKVS